MRSSLISKRERLNKISGKLIAFLLVFVICGAILAIPTKPAQAQTPVTDSISIAWQTTGTIWQKLARTADILWKKVGAVAFQQTIRSALNKFAYDAATYIGSGMEGQKPLFLTKQWPEYLGQISDQAGGEFLERFVMNINAPVSGQCSVQLKSCQTSCQDSTFSFDNEANAGNTQEDGITNIIIDESGLSDCLKKCYKKARECAGQSVDANGNPVKASSTNSYNPNYGTTAASFNVCSPSSLEAKLKIGLGLVEQSRPQAPNCTASDMVKSWGEEGEGLYKKITDYQEADFLDDFSNIFDPRSNDLGIYFLARTDMSSKAIIDTKNTENSLIANKGWMDQRDAAGNLVGLPGAAEAAKKQIDESNWSQFGKVTSDIVVDTANVFLNQLYITAFNRMMNNLGKTVTRQAGNIKNPEGGPTQYGEADLKEITSKLIRPDFSVRANYDILSDLSICSDQNNPGPTNCVLDSKFMQAISEKKTVAEAIKDGYLRGDWLLTSDNTRSDAYTQRNIAVLRQYRILPIGWELAIQKINVNPNKPKDATLMDLVSCFDAGDDYDQFSPKFERLNQGWCRNLIDPNWVLKAPLTKCEKTGVGAQKLSSTVIPGIKNSTNGINTLNELVVTRADNYCADNKTCIKEKNDGSCEAYGYCNEDRRTWNFGADSCQPINNTCQSFINTDNNKAISYLENTLVYGTCSSESAGCRQYSLFGSYASSTDSISWDENKSVYLNKNATDCSAKDEGCTELLRVKSTWGSNLIMDSGFVNDLVGASSTGGSLLNEWSYWGSANINNATRRATIVDSSQEPGGGTEKALKLEGTGPSGQQIVIGTFSNHDYSLLPKNLQIIPGKSYTLSADVYLVEGNMIHLFIGPNADFVKTTGTAGSWQHLSVTYPALNTYNDADFGINGESQTGQIKFYIKNLKFEMGGWDTGYRYYGGYKINEKLLPAYLENSCYVDASSASKDYRLKDDAPSICSNFARKCNKEEVGCELYKSAADSFAVPAQVRDSDYCAADCLGYDVYITKESYFNAPQAENIIPRTATACDADAVGCAEFTNLDAVASGGEQKEYYTSLKQCIKPSTTDCANFYAWEGTENGYQLKSYSLKKTVAGNPAVTSDDSSDCSADIYNLPFGAPGYNADCREFYNAAGTPSYHLISRTITCSDNCHSYRMSEKNVDKRLTQGECSGPDKQWDNANNFCYVCANGGVWDATTQACVYQAIPGEGKKCVADQNGCREYNGSNGNNVRLAAMYDFESGSAGWGSNCIGGVSVSTISNNKNGHSLYYDDSVPVTGCSSIGTINNGTPGVSKRRPLIEQLLASGDIAAQLPVGSFVNRGGAYTVKFLARAVSETNLEIYFINKDSGAKSVFNASSTLKIKGGNEWALYQANLDYLDHEVTSNEVLVMVASGNFYFDSFMLSEITDRYYLIKNSSVIPDICYYDIDNVYQGPDFNLGCAQYSDRANLQHNLHNFSKLCSNSAVGCEQMISTNNYAPYQSGIWNDTNGNGNCDPDEVDCVKVGGDYALYAVFDTSKQCNAADLGCSRLGQASGSGADIEWANVYKNNNPNNYNKSLCGQDEVGCEEWKKNDDSGYSYFKDPGNNVCTYRRSQDPTISDKFWYKIAVKRCDLNKDGQISGVEKGTASCNSASDCSGGRPCITDNNDYLCSVSYFKTIGLGGPGNQIPVPDQSAGICEAKETGCTEYIDPVSQFSPNLVYNPDYQMIGSSVEGWSGSPATQVVNLEPNKLYIFGRQAKSSSGNDEIRANFPANARPLLSDNSFGTSTNQLIIPTGADSHVMFNSLTNTSVTVVGGANDRIIELREAVIDYQLQSNIDKSSCSGQVKFDNGCVLFNERAVTGRQGLASLKSGWDAYTTVDGQAPTNCDSAVDNSCTANQLLKVRPNRVCSQWLDCLTYTGDDQNRVCYAVGECNRLDDKNECANFVSTPTTGFNRVFDPKKDRNASGYVLLDKYYLSQMKEVGLNSDAHYDFEDSVPALSCKLAIGSGNCSFTNIDKELLVREPGNNSADYPAHGKTYLKVPASYMISPHSSQASIKLVGGKEYFINYLVNTKNSGLVAKLIIKNVDTGVETEFLDKAQNGWERKIHAFTVPAGSYNNLGRVQIRLTASDNSSDNYVYFDDINIEPVLETGSDSAGNKSYAARECRLYPSEDSLTCSSKANDVIQDGLEGYCLEHDAKNSNVCLTWYPIDQISSSKPSIQQKGYKGKYPLNYCAEVNGNFSVVEKRTGVFVSAWDSAGYCDDDNEPYDGFQSQSDSNAHCGEDYVEVYWEYTHTHGDNHWCEGNYWCVPKTPGLVVKVMRGDSLQKVFDSTWPNYPTSSDSIVLSSGEIRVEGADDDQRDIIINSEGWYNFNGYEKIYQDRTCDTAPCNKVNEEENATPPVRVYNYDNPVVNEDDLKLVYSSEVDKVFRLTCNKFVQTIDSDGSNAAWTVRTGINTEYPTSTPPNFLDFLTPPKFYGDYSGPYQLTHYGRNNEDIPYGAAVWPDNFDLLSSEPVKLRNQYSKKEQETVFAGRPYGCDASNPKALGCGSIGYCSLNPSVYCLRDHVWPATNLAVNTCAAGGYGTCQSIWSQNGYPGKSQTTDYKNMLKTLFMKTFNSFSFSPSSQSYSPANISWDTTPAGGGATSCPNNVRPWANYVSVANSAASFCFVAPKVNNLAMKYNNVAIGSSSPFAIPGKGVYRLEFNTKIDSEQQPLKQIMIDWGDGTPIQVITGQDEHPAVEDKHVFYHFYSNVNPQSASVKITIYDNWGTYGTCSNSAMCGLVN